MPPFSTPKQFSFAAILEMLFKGFESRVGTLTSPLWNFQHVVFPAPPHNVGTRNARKEIKQEVRHVVCLRRFTLVSETQFLLRQSIPGLFLISQSLVLEIYLQLPLVHPML